jgi:hypothetical protein
VRIKGSVAATRGIFFEMVVMNATLRRNTVDKCTNEFNQNCAGNDGAPFKPGSCCDLTGQIHLKPYISDVRFLLYFSRFN